MIRSQLVARLAAATPHLAARDVERAVSAILERIATTLAEGGRVEVRGFGTFCVRHRAPRSGRNPRTGASVEVPTKTAITFKSGLALRRRLNVTDET